MPFSFNSVELCIVTINEKPWTRAREVCRALGYGKTIKTAHVVKAPVSPENYAHVSGNWAMCLLQAYQSIGWPNDSQKYDIYTNEEEMYELLRKGYTTSSFQVNRQRQKTLEDTASMCCFLHVWQQFSD